MEKLCKACNTVKAAANFYAKKDAKDGLMTYCKPCHKAKVSANYVAHPRWKAPEGFKKCTSCKEVQALEEFHANKHNPDGKSWTCRPCSVASVIKSRQKNPESHRAASRRWARDNPDMIFAARLRKYGITLDDYKILFARAGGVCEICHTHDTHYGLHVDHCHDTKIVRGLLCTRCNTGIGQFLHNEDRLMSAINYLTRTAKGPPAG